MPTVIACPACRAKLTVPDHLLGKKVRCSACKAAVDVPAASPDLPLQLTLDDPTESTPSHHQAEAKKDDLVGAVELNPGSDRSHAAPAPAAEEAPPHPQPPDGKPSPELFPKPAPRGEDDDDMRPCPACGLRIHRVARRCYSCGERLGRHWDEDEDEPRRPRRRLRRDCLPHRGSVILALGIVGLVLMLGCGPIGAVFGICAWTMGHHDLARMNRQEMDDEGRGMTQAGWICGIFATALGILWSLSCIGFWTWIYYENTQYQRKPGPPFRPVAPLRKMTAPPRF